MKLSKTKLIESIGKSDREEWEIELNSGIGKIILASCPHCGYPEKDAKKSAGGRKGGLAKKPKGFAVNRMAIKKAQETRRLNREADKKLASWRKEK